MWKRSKPRGGLPRVDGLEKREFGAHLLQCYTLLRGVFLVGLDKSFWAQFGCCLSLFNTWLCFQSCVYACYLCEDPCSLTRTV